MGLSLPLADPLWDWIKRTWTAKPQTVELTFVRVDPTGQARSKRVLHNASITEIAFPALDSASKDPALLTFTVKAEKTVDTKATGKVASPTKSAAQRRWLASGFRFGLSGLDTKAVSRIESFSVTSTPGAAIDFPSLRVTLPATQSKPWQEWFDHFVLQGHNTAGDEKSGVIALLAADRKEFARIKLEGVGIARLARLSSDSETAVSRLTADLYCQRMGFGPTS